MYLQLVGREKELLLGKSSCFPICCMPYEYGREGERLVQPAEVILVSVSSTRAQPRCSLEAIEKVSCGANAT